MGLKVLDYIEAVQTSRVVPDHPFFSHDFYREPVSELRIDQEWAWRIDLRIGARLVGPEEARRHLMEHMRSMIADELYGEVIKEVRDVIHSMHEKGAWSRYNDELNKLHNIVNKMRGGK